MTPCAACPFRGCENCAWQWEVPGQMTLEGLDQTTKTWDNEGSRKTPASAATDRGHGPTDKESNVRNSTPSEPSVGNP